MLWPAAGRDQEGRQKRGAKGLLRRLEQHHVASDPLVLPTRQAVVQRGAQAGPDQHHRSGAEIQHAGPHHRDGDRPGHSGGLDQDREPQPQHQQQEGVFVPGQQIVPHHPVAEGKAGLIQHRHAHEQQACPQQNHDGVADPVGDGDVEIQNRARDRERIGDGDAGVHRHQDHQGGGADLRPDRQQDSSFLGDEPGPHETDDHERHGGGALGDETGNDPGQGGAPAGADRRAHHPSRGRPSQRRQIGRDEAHAAEQQAEPGQEQGQQAHDRQAGVLPFRLWRPALTPAPGPPTPSPREGRCR